MLSARLAAGRPMMLLVSFIGILRMLSLVSSSPMTASGIMDRDSKLANLASLQFNMPESSRQNVALCQTITKHASPRVRSHSSGAPEEVCGEASEDQASCSM